MKKINKLMTAAILLISIAMINDVNAQGPVQAISTINYIMKFTNSSTSTPTAGSSVIQESSSNIGIGLSPSFKLDVNGDINISGSNVFRIGNYPFLFNNNITSCLFVGYLTGYSGSDNTFIGSSAGNSNQGIRNTYIGSNAGASGTNGNCNQNTAVGNNALTSSTAYGGCALGYNAAGGSTTGCGLTAMGEEALILNTTGGYNCAFGHDAGGTNVTGSNNTFLGNLADAGASNLSNSAAIGANAVTEYSNEMVLGDISTYVGIGFSGVNTFPPGRLSVDETVIDVSTPTIAGFFHNGDQQSNAASSFEKKAVYAYSDGEFSNRDGGWVLKNIGGDFEAGNAEEVNIAVRGRTGNLSVDNYGLTGYGGVFAASKSANVDIGVSAKSDGSGSQTNYGLYAEAPIGSCNNGSCSDAAGYFNGDVYTTSTAYFTSDANLKDNIQPIQNATAIVNALNPKTFTFRTNQFPFMNLPYGNQDGLVAQDLINVLPQLVKSFKVPPRLDSLGHMDTTGTNTPFMAVNYVGIIPYLIGAVKEQQQSIDSLHNQLASLQAQINNCCANAPVNPIHRVRNPIDVELGSENMIILNQNNPNPFTEQTHINFSIPSNVKEAKMIFFDNTGHVMQSVTINERGDCQINVYGEKLSSGIYSYSLIADGKIIDTKKMLCNK